MDDQKQVEKDPKAPKKHTVISIDEDPKNSDWIRITHDKNPDRLDPLLELEEENPT